MIALGNEKPRLPKPSNAMVACPHLVFMPPVKTNM